MIHDSSLLNVTLCKDARATGGDGTDARLGCCG